METLITKFKYDEIDVCLHTHDDDLGRHIKRENSFYEKEILDDIRQYIKPGGLVIDVGANIGNHTVFFSKVCGAQTIALEPCEVNARLLVLNTRDNCDPIKYVVYMNPVWDNNYSYFRSILNDSNLGMVTLQEIPYNVPHSPDVTQSITIDRLVDEHRLLGKVSFIKIDVEGSEVHVLNGAKETIMKHRPKILIEKKDNITAIEEFFEDCDYVTKQFWTQYDTVLMVPKELEVNTNNMQEEVLVEQISNNTKRKPRKTTRTSRPRIRAKAKKSV